MNWHQDLLVFVFIALVSVKLFHTEAASWPPNYREKNSGLITFSYLAEQSVWSRTFIRSKRASTQAEGPQIKNGWMSANETISDKTQYGRSIGAWVSPLQPLRSPTTATTDISSHSTSTGKSKSTTKKINRKRHDYGTKSTTSKTTTLAMTKTQPRQRFLKSLPKPKPPIRDPDLENPAENDQWISHDLPILFHSDPGNQDRTEFGDDGDDGKEAVDSSNDQEAITAMYTEMMTITIKASTTFKSHSPYLQCNSSNINVPDSRLCGYPAFYDKTTCAKQFCSDAHLSKCDNKGSMITFVAFTLLLGLFIVVSNCVLPYLVYREPKLRCHHTYIKVSLAFADMLNGFILMFSVVPNMFWFRNLPERTVVASMQNDNHSAYSIVLGSILIASTQSSTLHLLFLTIERFVAIKSPMRHSVLKSATIFYILAGVWALSILFAFVPALLPEFFEYTFNQVVFVYMLSAKSLSDRSLGYHGLLYACFTILLSYVMMVLFSIWTGVTVHAKLNSSPLSIVTSSVGRERGILGHKMPKLTTEMAVFKTLTIMIIAFSLTLVPIFVIIILFNIGNYDCENYSLAYTISFYASISNSFVNVIIYTARDKRFRKALFAEISKMSGGKKIKQFVVNRRKIELFSTTSNLP